MAAEGLPQDLENFTCIAWGYFSAFAKFYRHFDYGCGHAELARCFYRPEAFPCLPYRPRKIFKFRAIFLKTLLEPAYKARLYYGSMVIKISYLFKIQVKRRFFKNSSSLCNCLHHAV